MDELVTSVLERFAALEKSLQDPDLYQDRNRAAELNREHAGLVRAAELARQYVSLCEDVEIAEMEDDAEGRTIIQDAPCQLEEILVELRKELIEPDPRDAKDVIVEIRAGAGGQEAALFAGELWTMLTNYATCKGMQVEEIESSAMEGGGFKEVVFAVKGKGAHSLLKHEAGTHRVQRVPQTETQGRIHTSTATVAVLPEADDIEIEIKPEDLKTETMRSGGPGGQHANKTSSVVRITHLPTGLNAIASSKSQHQNRLEAMRILRARLYEQITAETEAEAAKERQGQVGQGDRSEKIRTYNFAQGRVTDHRIKLTSHNLDGVLTGELDEFTEALREHEAEQNHALNIQS